MTITPSVRPGMGSSKRAESPVGQGAWGLGVRPAAVASMVLLASCCGISDSHEENAAPIVPKVAILAHVPNLAPIFIALD
ncbi:MAG: hypothetical protein ABGY32_10450 [bacterium]